MSREGDRDQRRHTGFALPRLLLAGLLVAVALTPCRLVAQADAAKAPLASDRYLLMVETSRSMQRRADGVLQTVQDLLKSGLSEQMRRGDTLGVWTYNESLHAGRFPLQRWSPEKRNDIALRTLAFLKGQKYEKQASLDKVLPALDGVVKASPRITIILISSADENIRGTPFDDRINTFYQKWRDAQQKDRMPFVTVLRGQDGQLADFTVNTPPWPVQMPRRPQEAQIVETAPSKRPETVRAAPPPTVPPLIISGRKAKPEVAPAPKPEPPGTNIQALVPAQEATNGSKSLIQGPETKPAAPAPAKAEAASALPPSTVEPKPTVVDLPKPSPAPEPKPTPVPAAVTESKAEVVNKLEAKPAAPVPANAEAAAAVPSPTAERVRAVRAAQEDSPGTSANTTTAASAFPAFSPLSPRTSRLPVAPAQTATAVPAETLVRRTSIWIAALVLAGVAISVIFLLRRRARATAGASLITQSFERKNKP